MAKRQVYALAPAVQSAHVRLWGEKKLSTKARKQLAFLRAVFLGYEDTTEYSAGFWIWYRIPIPDGKNLRWLESMLRIGGLTYAKVFCGKDGLRGIELRNHKMTTQGKPSHVRQAYTALVQSGIAGLQDTLIACFGPLLKIGPELIDSIREHAWKTTWDWTASKATIDKDTVLSWCQVQQTRALDSGDDSAYERFTYAIERLEGTQWFAYDDEKRLTVMDGKSPYTVKPEIEDGRARIPQWHGKPASAGYDRCKDSHYAEHDTTEIDYELVYGPFPLPAQDTSAHDTLQARRIRERKVIHEMIRILRRVLCDFSYACDYCGIPPVMPQ